jgi:hypothetical protein
MEPDGDPEARIRDLERPLANQASASEMGTRPYDATPSATVPVPPYPYSAPHQHDPYQAQPYPQYEQGGSPYYAPPQHVVHKRSPSAALWVIPLAVVCVLVAGVIGLVVYSNVGSPAPASPGISGGGGSVDSPDVQIPDIQIPDIEIPDVQVPPTTVEEIVTVGPGGSFGLGGVNQKQTIVCDQGSVSISGMNNTVQIQGACATVSVSGFENNVTVDSAQTISASGFDNKVTYRDGTPEISRSGQGNLVEQG